MFINNKYYSVYYTLINKALSRGITREAGFEIHHIIPKSLGGSKDISNLVKLTLREHFICHLCLIKITEGNAKHKMSFAANLMLSEGVPRTTSKIYAMVKQLGRLAFKKLWDTPEFKEKMRSKKIEYWKNLNKRAHFSIISKANWNDPTLRKQMMESMKIRWTPKERLKQSNAQIEAHRKDPTLSEKKANHKEANGMFGKTHTLKARKVMAKTAKNTFTGKTYEEICGSEKAKILKKIRSAQFKKNATERNWTGANNPRAKTFNLISPEGIKHIITGRIVAFCKENKLDFGSVSNLVKGNRQNYKGWTAF